jgi:repressor LexA
MPPANDQVLTGKRREILEVIEASLRDRGYPPSVREIGEAVGLTSSSSVHAHLSTLQKQGYLRRDPTKPRAMEVRFDVNSGSQVDKARVRHLPLVGHVAAGTGVLADEHVEELLPLPEEFTGTDAAFVLRVRGDSMIDAAILDGDYVVVRSQVEVRNGDVVVVGIPGGEATVKTFRKKGSSIILEPANARLEPMVFSAADVVIYGKVVSVLRRL